LLKVTLRVTNLTKSHDKTAIAHLKKAVDNAPNAASKGRLEANIAKLESGEDIN